MRPHAIQRARRARDSRGGGGGGRGSNGVIGRAGQIPVARHWSASAWSSIAAFPQIRSAILKTSQPMMVIPTPQKSMTETTASSYLLHSPYVLRRRMASNKLFVRLSGEAVGLLCPSAGPSLCGRTQRRRLLFQDNLLRFRALSGDERPRRFRIPRGRIPIYADWRLQAAAR